MHNALRAEAVNSADHVLTGAGHGDLSFPGNVKAGLARSTQKVIDLAASFLDGSQKGQGSA
jgi:hypothetical protein